MEILAMKEQEKFTEEEILQEIEPLLRDYFIARFRKTESGIMMKLLNGQKFELLVVQM